MTTAHPAALAASPRVARTTLRLILAQDPCGPQKPPHGPHGPQGSPPRMAGPGSSCSP